MNCKFYHTIFYKSKPDYNLCTLVEYKYAPKTFLDVWQKNANRNLNFELRNNDLFTIPRANLEYLKNIPFFSYPAEWNTLGDLRFQNKKITF